MNMEVATTEEKFHAAVELIKNLPKAGSIHPSNDLRLRFYSYFKQATEGPCELPRPSFWDIVNRAKWDAWNKLGNMSKEEAMKNYVEEFIKIIETSPFEDSNSVKGLIHIMGPYIDYAPKELREKHILINGNASKPLNKPEDINENFNVTNAGKSLKGHRTEFSDESSEGLFSAASTLNGHNINGGNDSDSDEFSDTLDRVNETESEDPSGGASLSSGSNINNPVTNVKGPNIVYVRGGGDQRVGGRDSNSPAASGSGNRGNRTSRQTRSADSPLQHALNNNNIGGAGGSRRSGGNIGLEQSADMNEQLALAVIRLQHTMEQVVIRLDSLETLLLERNSDASLQASITKKSFWSFLGVSPKAAIVILAWPFIVHWLMYLIRKRRRQL